jgi:hypothetical protein
MGLIKEPKEVDLSTKSEPWTEEELNDFRKLMNEIKLKNAKRRKIYTQTNTKAKQRV